MKSFWSTSVSEQLGTPRLGRGVRGLQLQLLEGVFSKFWKASQLPIDMPKAELVLQLDVPSKSRVRSARMQILHVPPGDVCVVVSAEDGGKENWHCTWPGGGEDDELAFVLLHHGPTAGPDQTSSERARKTKRLSLHSEITVENSLVGISEAAWRSA
ncbi:hypothetical protein AK812_SmicGene43273 [Symbiodinium microadriaticum]|uniref:Uncharacterized protein n=1 Tax=Symbiodinium microadriaticum TaxID=2951 RepID=A0A1Q9C1G0_SYMMI|nr:hypothetical protein AK812_SmicGene43273 [Symbiodinium microadriaticum]